MNLEAFIHSRELPGRQTENLRLAKRVVRHGAIEVNLNGLDWLGRKPLVIMKNLSEIRRKGAGVNLRAEEIAQDSYDHVVPALLARLSVLERRETAKQTSDAVRNAKVRGSSLGRPLVMTPERKVIAARMLAQGRRGREVLLVVQGLKGPGISQSAYYLWQKAWLRKQNSDYHG